MHAKPSRRTPPGWMQRERSILRCEITVYNFIIFCCDRQSKEVYLVYKFFYQLLIKAGRDSYLRAGSVEIFGLDLAALLITQDLALMGSGIRGTTALPKRAPVGADVSV